MNTTRYIPLAGYANRSAAVREGVKVHICRFDTVSDLRGKDRTYENIKAAVLKAGRFSCFDVETKRDGVMFTQLCNDPEIEVVKMDYPWTGIRRLTMRAADGARFCPACHALLEEHSVYCDTCGTDTPRR